MGSSKRNESGLVAIVVATIIMVIMSLLTLGFARLMQREQRQATDRSLSTQAFYAAESGINDAIDNITTGAFGASTTPKTDCDANAPGYDGNFGQAVNTSYTCILLNMEPPELVYPVTTSESKLIQLKAQSATPIAKITIGWEDMNTILPPSYPGVCNGRFPENASVANWPSTAGLLRVDLVDTQPPFTRTTLTDGTISMFLYPVGACGGSTNSVTFASQQGEANKGNIIRVSCSAATTPRDCELSIDTSAAPRNAYSLRLKSMYHNSDVFIRAYNAAGTQLNFSGGQAIIDSTGKAADVLRRLQVRLPLSKDYVIPDYTAQFKDKLCKLLEYTQDTITDNCTGQTGTFKPPSSDPSGLAGVLVWCDTHVCSGGGGGGGGGSLNYKATFTNASNNNRAVVAGCTWDFGDGSIIRDQKCYFGDTISHSYPIKPLPGIRYSVKLTVRFNNGAAPKVSPTVYQWIPS